MPVNVTVAVSKMNDNTGKSETLCVLGRNNVFGELGIINSCRRNASIVSRYPVELIVFTDQVHSCINFGDGQRSNCSKLQPHTV